MAGLVFGDTKLLCFELDPKVSNMLKGQCMATARQSGNTPQDLFARTREGRA